MRGKNTKYYFLEDPRVRRWLRPCLHVATLVDMLFLCWFPIGYFHTLLSRCMQNEGKCNLQEQQEVFFHAIENLMEKNMLYPIQWYLWTSTWEFLYLRFTLASLEGLSLFSETLQRIIYLRYLKSRVTNNLLRE